MRPSSTIWYFNLGVDWSTGVVINGKKFYATANNGCLVIYPDNKTVQYFGKNWFND